MSRLYDPTNPRFLSREEIARLSPADCAAACEELDQNILSTLHSIDSNFVETTRVITDVLIPSVERYGESSREIWDSVKVRFRTWVSYHQFHYHLVIFRKV